MKRNWTLILHVSLFWETLWTVLRNTFQSHKPCDLDVAQLISTNLPSDATNTSIISGLCGQTLSACGKFLGKPLIVCYCITRLLFMSMLTGLSKGDTTHMIRRPRSFRLPELLSRNKPDQQLNDDGNSLEALSHMLISWCLRAMLCVF